MRCFEGELDSQESVKHLSMIDARLGQSPPLPLPLRRCFPPDYGLGRNTPAPQPKCWWTSRLARPSVTCVCVTQTLVCLRHDENTKTIQRVNILLRHESPPPPDCPPLPRCLNWPWLPCSLSTVVAALGTEQKAAHHSLWSACRCGVCRLCGPDRLSVILRRIRTRERALCD